VDPEARPFRLGQTTWKTSMGLQKQFPNTQFHLELAKFWAVAHFPNPEQRHCASAPECQASLGSQNAEKPSGVDSEARPLRLRQKIWKTSLGVQKQLTNT